jgi:hypothetical protein
MKQLLHVFRVVVCLSSDGREETQYFPFRCWLNTRTPESNPWKYLQSKNEYNFLSMVGFKLGTLYLKHVKQARYRLTVPPYTDVIVGLISDGAEPMTF